MNILLTLVCLNIWLFCLGHPWPISKCKPDLENGYYKQQRNGEIVYACDSPYVSNIPGLQKMLFGCVFTSAFGFFELKAASSRFQNPWGPIYLRNITCLPKTECSNPPLPANMVRDRTVQYEEDVVLNGVVQPRDKFYSGDTFEYMCQDGYAVAEEPISYDYYHDYAPAEDSNEAKETITCDISGRWNGQEDNELTFGKCEEILCDASRFSDMRNGNITDFKPSYKFGEEMRLVCNEGYKPKAANSVVKCTTNSSFDHFTLPSFGCEPITCLEPVNPKNGQMRLHGVYVGDKATFDCNSGYNLIGSAEWTCLPNGKWGATCARCESQDSRSHCPAPCIPLGANVTSTEDEFSVGSVLEFVCISGGEYFGGSENRTCMKNGKWSGTPIDCTGDSVYDEHVGMALRKALEEQVPDNDRNEIYDDYMYTINVGQMVGVDVYLLVDVSRNTNNVKFTARQRFINAILPVLGINSDVRGTRLAVYYFALKSKKMFDMGHFDYHPYESYIDAQQFINSTHHVDDIRKYVGSGTDIAAALGDVIVDLETKTMLISRGIYRQAKQVVILISDGVSTTGGSPVQSAEKLKDVFGVEIYSVFVGDVIKDKIGYNTMKEIASKIENEEHFFALKDIRNIDDDLNQMTRGDVKVSCGMTRAELTKLKNDSYPYEQEASEHAWPWMVEVRSYTEHVCGGSLIDEQWILTAASCFNDRKPIEQVHLKKLRLHQTTAFFSSPVEPSDIHIHPQFNEEVLPRHKYDIALIRLQQVFPVGPELLPVCLWNDMIKNTTNKNYTDFFSNTIYGVVTGWGYSHNMIYRSTGLKQMQMNVKSHKECIQNLNEAQRREVDENLMFCAGGSETVNGELKYVDSCQGDGGGPFVVEHPTEENKYIQTGVVSFGFGCRQPGIYGFYTKLTEELLEWIRNTIDKYNFQ